MTGGGKTFLCFCFCFLFLPFLLPCTRTGGGGGRENNHQTLLQPTIDTCLEAIELKMQAHVLIENSLYQSNEAYLRRLNWMYFAVGNNVLLH